MRKEKWLMFFLSALLAVVGYAQSPKVSWVSLEEALRLQKKEPKKIIIDVFVNWCRPCEYFQKYTLENQQVVDYINKNFYAVKFNAESNESIEYKGTLFLNPFYDASKEHSHNSMHEFAKYLMIDSYPTVVFMDEASNFILPLVGVHEPEVMVFFLKLIATDSYKNYTSSEQLKEDYRLSVAKPTLLNTSNR